MIFQGQGDTAVRRRLNQRARTIFSGTFLVRKEESRKESVSAFIQFSLRRDKHVGKHGAQKSLSKGKGHTQDKRKALRTQLRRSQRGHQADPAPDSAETLPLRRRKWQGRQRGADAAATQALPDPRTPLSPCGPAETREHQVDSGRTAGLTRSGRPAAATLALQGGGPSRPASNAGCVHATDAPAAHQPGASHTRPAGEADVGGPRRRRPETHSLPSSHETGLRGASPRAPPPPERATPSGRRKAARPRTNSARRDTPRSAIGGRSGWGRGFSGRTALPARRASLHSAIGGHSRGGVVSLLPTLPGTDLHCGR